MIIQFYKRYQPINYFIVIFIAALLWLNFFIYNDIAGIHPYDTPVPIYGYIYSALSSTKLILVSKFIAFALIIIQASFISGINNQYNLLGFRSYLPGLIYILFVSNFDEFKALHPVHLANLFFILAWYELKKSESTFSDASYFNASFLIGLSSLFYFNYIYLIIIVIIHLILNNQGSRRQIIVLIFGVVSVWYLYLSVFFLISGHLQDLFLLFNFQFSFKEITELNLNQTVVITYVMFLILFASINLVGYYIGLKINYRKNLSFLFFVFAMSFLLVVGTNSTFELVYLAAIPISQFLSLFFTKIKSKWISESLFLIFIILTLINNVFPNLFLIMMN